MITLPDAPSEGDVLATPWQTSVYRDGRWVPVERTPEEVDALMERIPPDKRRLCRAVGGCGCVGCIHVPAYYPRGVRPVSPSEFAAWKARHGVTEEPYPQAVALQRGYP